MRKDIEKKIGEMVVKGYGLKEVKDLRYIAGATAMLDLLMPFVEVAEFYDKFAEPDNHQFIFDDPESSRAEIYERYKQYSIGDVGIKARQALSDLRAKLHADLHAKSGASDG